MKLRFIERLADVDSQDWDQLRQDNYPFLSYAFLNALEESNCVSGKSGWAPMHLIGESDGELVLAMPLYLKSHSYGEYVFDWQWANAFETHGRRYFPKLLTAIPFTPATGPRILAKEAPTEPVISGVMRHIKEFALANQISSWHLLFPEEDRAKFQVGEMNMLLREDVQFHWFNQNFADFDSSLASFRSSKRKQVRRERRRVCEQGIQIEQKTGAELELSDWQAFYQCYKATYYKRSGHSGYLNWDFFARIAEQMSDQVMLVLARSSESPGQQVVASSLFFFDDHSLYGRYWGALQDIDCLHFEACYYQGIDFAISKGLKQFNPGTQGEHKLVRGFEPVKTCSLHWIADPDFSQAIDEYLERERRHTNNYEQAAERHLPFRRD